MSWEAQQGAPTDSRLQSKRTTTQITTLLLPPPSTTAVVTEWNSDCLGQLVSTLPRSRRTRSASPNQSRSLCSCHHTLVTDSLSAHLYSPISPAMSLSVPVHDRVGEFLLLLETTNGRDKLCRFIQFAAKFAKWKEETSQQRDEKMVQVRVSTKRHTQPLTSQLAATVLCTTAS